MTIPTKDTQRHRQICESKCNVNWKQYFGLSFFFFFFRPIEPVIFKINGDTTHDHAAKVV